MSAGALTALASMSQWKHRRAVEQGLFDLWMGEDSTAIEHVTFSVAPWVPIGRGSFKVSDV